MSDNLIPAIRGALPELRPAERKVAAMVLAEMDFAPAPASARWPRAPACPSPA